MNMHAFWQEILADLGHASILEQIAALAASIALAWVLNRMLVKRLVKRQQMQWTKKGAHLLMQARTKVLNEEWEDCFRQQRPGFRQLPAEALPMAA